MKRQFHSIKTLLAVFLAVMACSAGPSLAEGGQWWKPGPISWIEEKADELKRRARAEFSVRNESGLDYALDPDSDFSVRLTQWMKDLVRDAIAKAIIKEMTPGEIDKESFVLAADITNKLRRYFNKATEGEEEISKNDILKMLEDGLTVFIKLTLPATGCKKCAVLITPAKVISAFGTAYGYGFLHPGTYPKY